MTYRIEGLPPGRFEDLIGLSDDALARRGARRVRATSRPGFPCRIGLEDAEVGESMILLNFASHDVPTPFRTTYGIYVREKPAPSPQFVDRIPPVFEGRTLGLRGFDADGMLRDALLALPGEADSRIRALFEQPEIASIHAHNAVYGCFLAKVERTI
jgi:hypothetical protein